MNRACACHGPILELVQVVLMLCLRSCSKIRGNPRRKKSAPWGRCSNAGKHTSYLPVISVSVTKPWSWRTSGRS